MNHWDLAGLSGVKVRLGTVILHDCGTINVYPVTVGSHRLARRPRGVPRLRSSAGKFSAASDRKLWVWTRFWRDRTRGSTVPRPGRQPDP